MYKLGTKCDLGSGTVVIVKTRTTPINGNSERKSNQRFFCQVIKHSHRLKKVTSELDDSFCLGATSKAIPLVEIDTLFGFLMCANCCQELLST